MLANLPIKCPKMHNLSKFAHEIQYAKKYQLDSDCFLDDKYYSISNYQ